MASVKSKYDMVILWEEGTNCVCDINNKYFCKWDKCKPYGINVGAGTVEPLEAVNKTAAAVISSDDFASRGKKETEVKNDRLISRWQDQYGFHNGIREVLEEVNFTGKCRTHCPHRAFFAAYVLCKEGYNARVI